MGGRGNDHIENMVAQEIYENPTTFDVVIVALSGWYRFSTPQHSLNYHHLFSGKKKNPILGHINKDDIDFSLIYDRNILHMKKIVEMCKQAGKKLIMFQMLETGYMRGANKDLISDAILHMMSSRAFVSMKRDTPTSLLLGWPYWHTLGGESIQKSLEWHNEENRHRRMSDDDDHPNGAGHEHIAQKLEKMYRECKNSMDDRPDQMSTFTKIRKTFHI